MKKDKELKVYEVYVNTPCGDLSLGFFFKKKDAVKKAEKHNKKIKCTWDEAKITWHEVK